MVNKKPKRIVETPFNAKNLRELGKAGFTIRDIVGLPRKGERSFKDRIEVKRLN